ncbi:MAG: hypothetical protein ACD_51C00337G0004 [uncultured bacterium]|nr:MAG: hypothetical protein ACD_51C00337G0004 [uncultured bacterium]OGJ47377.1 MAG: hypothetical protein A2244_02710 [Candidatus Peregrinibacteria bacterium RIFOXYA2_FULL_41_18]OGJ49071.1 MAG: hypothetical protein A2344_05815 [Candidatus Peregrinibacteria bacterium RIFOXYB12_FULL_41_12]OGJ52535.1 MAG: hypothetical protein A2448_00045 [Candidatus Peregrinibacteria bacterium RIFOXYC2_FULL_41_22]
MKRILITISLITILTGCISENLGTIKELEEKLETVTTSEDERIILQDLLNIAIENPEINMILDAKDKNNNEVINNLSEATEPINVTIRFYSKYWSKKINFTPLEKENVYILMQE